MMYNKNNRQVNGGVCGGCAIQVSENRVQAVKGGAVGLLCGDQAALEEVTRPQRTFESGESLLCRGEWSVVLPESRGVLLCPAVPGFSQESGHYIRYPPCFGRGTSGNALFALQGAAPIAGCNRPPTRFPAGAICPACRSARDRGRYARSRPAGSFCERT